MISMNIRTSIGAVFFIALGGIIWWQSQDLSMMGAVFPRVIAIAMIMTSALIILRALLINSQTTEETDESGSITRSPWRGIALVASIAAWIILIKPLGLLLSSLLAFAILMLISEQGRFSFLRTIIILLAGAVGIGSIVVVMTEVLLIPVPKGIF